MHSYIPTYLPTYLPTYRQTDRHTHTHTYIHNMNKETKFHVCIKFKNHDPGWKQGN